MPIHPDQLRAIEAREKKIAEEITALQKEADELATAKRVLSRLNGEAADSADRGAPRPSGTPKNFEMMEMVLARAEKDGKDGLTAAEIVNEIRAHYWPGLVGEQILPSIYAFAKKGRVRKTSNGKFNRIKGPTAGAAEPSI